MKKTTISLLFIFFLFYGQIVHAQSEEVFVPDKQIVVKAQVLEIIKEESVNLLGTDTKHDYQELKIKIVEGEEKGKVLIIENDYQKLNKNEIFYLKKIISSLNSEDSYSVYEPYRMPQVLFLVGLFLLAILIFGGIQGVRGVVSLFGSLLLIFYVLLPGILNGISPLFVTIGVSSLIIIVGSYITHGFNKMTSSAVIGMLITVSFTGLLAYWSVYFTRLSGFGSEEVVYLNMGTAGGIDVIGLLLGGIMIGLLGVLYDVAIGQATAVEELFRVSTPDISNRVIYKRAIRIGREHIGALVNTLAIAYVGVALPLLLLLFQSPAESIWVTINREIFSMEIVRVIIGGIGLILAVPITTLVSIYLLKRPKNR
jgi:uncharacterized membrane protein